MLKEMSCGALRSENNGQFVTLAGWVHRRRDHGSLIFIDMRDREGIVQVVFNPETAKEAHSTAEMLRNEWVIQVRGRVESRPAGTSNSDLPTGEIEVYATEINVLNESLTPPFYVNDESEMTSLLTDMVIDSATFITRDDDLLLGIIESVEYSVKGLEIILSRTNNDFLQ